MRLIDADKITNEVCGCSCNDCKTKDCENTDYSVADIMKLIREQSPSYDLDKVINQLEEATWSTMPSYDCDGYPNDDDEDVIYSDVAIEIVSKCGICDQE